MPEYWIIDAAARTLVVLRLAGGAYVEHGSFGPGQTATSHHLPGFAVAVDEVLAQGRQPIGKATVDRTSGARSHRDGRVNALDVAGG